MFRTDDKETIKRQKIQLIKKTLERMTKGGTWLGRLEEICHSPEN